MHACFAVRGRGICHEREKREREREREKEEREIQPPWHNKMKRNEPQRIYGNYSLWKPSFMNLAALALDEASPLSACFPRATSTFRYSRSPPRTGSP